MARNKPTPKPLFSLKQDFIDSLEHFCHQAIFLHQQVQSALELGAIKESVAPLIKARLDAFRAAMAGDED